MKSELRDNPKLSRTDPRPRIKQVPLGTGPTTVFEHRRIRCLMLHVLIFYELQCAVHDLGSFQALQVASRASEHEVLRKITLEVFYCRRSIQAHDAQNLPCLPMIAAWMLKQAVQGYYQSLTSQVRFRSSILDDDFGHRTICCPRPLPLMLAAFRMNQARTSGDTSRCSMCRTAPLSTILLTQRVFLLGEKRLCSFQLLPTQWH